MRVPLLDLQAQYRSLQPEIDRAMTSVVASAAFIGGAEVDAFEDEFADYCETRGCVGVGNGTDALYLALRALGVGTGDEVLTVSHTFIATAGAIRLTGATPVFVDIDPQTMLMDPEGLAPALTERTRAIVPVHLYGQCCPMDRIMSFAEKNRLLVVEDAAQAHGATWQGRKAGSFGAAGTFSFYPGKNLGAYGDAGAVVSQDPGFLDRVRKLSNHGREDKYTHIMEGVNSRLDALQAAVLRVKLRHLDGWNQARRNLAETYLQRLKGTPWRLPRVRPEAVPVWHLFVVRQSQRDSVLAGLGERGVGAGVHYPLPVHLQPAFRDHTLRFPLPHTEQAASQCLSLPLFPEMSEEQLDHVVESLAQLSELPQE